MKDFFQLLLWFAGSINETNYLFFFLEGSITTLLFGAVSMVSCTWTVFSSTDSTVVTFPLRPLMTNSSPTDGTCLSNWHNSGFLDSKK
jgi:hypothetical protein